MKYKKPIIYFLVLTVFAGFASCSLMRQGLQDMADLFPDNGKTASKSRTDNNQSRDTNTGNKTCVDPDNTDADADADTESGKTDLSMLNGKWRIKALYAGSYESYTQKKRARTSPASIYVNPCSNKDYEAFIFNVAKKTYQRTNCGIVSKAKTWTATDTGTKTVIKSASGETFNIVKLGAKQLIMEGKFIFNLNKPGTGIYVLEKIG